MKKFSNDSSINSLVHQLIRQGWRVRIGKKHDVIIAPNNRRVAIPSSPSDFRSFVKFSHDIRRLTGV